MGIPEFQAWGTSRAQLGTRRSAVQNDSPDNGGRRHPETALRASSCARSCMEMDPLMEAR